MKKEVSLLELKLEEKKRKLQSLIAQVYTNSFTQHQSKQRQIEKEQQNTPFASSLPDELSMSVDIPSPHEESESSFQSISIPDFTFSDLPSLCEPESYMPNDDLALFM